MNIKSPGDDINIGTFYKALSYACLYKADETGIENIYNTNTTISLVREDKPIKTFKTVRRKIYSYPKIKWDLSNQWYAISHADTCNKGIG